MWSDRRALDFPFVFRVTLESLRHWYLSCTGDRDWMQF